MQKLLVVVIFLTMVLGCKKEAKETNGDENELVFFSFQNMPRTQEVNAEAEEILNNWKEFQALQSSFNVMNKASNNEDLALAIDDLLEKEKSLREGDYPEAFDKPQIKSRQRVLRTYLLKIKSSIADRTDVNEPMKQMLEANNAWRAQFNVLVNNKLDLKLILDEQ
ncbi:hypothetical protein [Croceitalea rosinachiae]|uniref:Lipoprotein n=1 Tax=Croceitalea rosinachiae TaxID=3075596 RepID=A0ABU3A6X0_9FLAO|nr:hypothetical protein [Croceitalea sp. F388]MDT0605921.1 hypothetical protein [Croceitalea sp. F388]